MSHPAPVFRPGAKLDPSQVVDRRAPTPMDYVSPAQAATEVGGSWPGGFIEDPNTGARIATPYGRKWWPLPPQGTPVNYHPPPIPSRLSSLMRRA